MQIDYDKLYELSQDFSIRGGSMIVTEAGDAIEDELALLRAEIRPRKAIRFNRDSGRRICDVIWATLPLVIVSRGLRDVLKRRKFTGWSTYPVIVFDGEGKQVRNYFGLSIIGRAGPVDETRCKKVWRPPIYEGGPKIQRYVGLFFEDDRWDGSDFVIPEGSAYTIVTARVKDALQTLNIPNVEFEPLDTYERDL